MPNKTILSTAELPAESIALLRDAGWDCRILNCITIVPRSDATLKQLAEERSARQESVIFTSANAVMAVAGLITNPDIVHWDVYCLSGKTADTVRKLFPNAHIRATAPDSASLAREAAIRRHSGYLFFCGGSRMETLPRLLRESGIAIEEHIVYDTLLNKPLWEHTPCAVLFFSPSAIESLMARNDLSKVPLLACIGNSTAAAIPATWNNKVIIASAPSKQSVVETLLQNLQNTTDIC